MRKPRGFRAGNVPVGVLFVREEDDGKWVILAGEPEVKLDNKHRDGRPHMHVGAWDSEDRRELRADLTAKEAREAIARQLAEKGYLDPGALEEDLG
jgi:hypothetical protein